MVQRRDIDEAIRLAFREVEFSFSPGVKGIDPGPSSIETVARAVMAVIEADAAKERALVSARIKSTLSELTRVIHENPRLLETRSDESTRTPVPHTAESTD
jgi:hypothetical protein